MISLARPVRGAMKRKLASVLTPAEMLAKCLDSHHSPICAGHAMAIVELLRERRWSIPALAAASGVKRQTISAIIAMELYPTGDKLDRIAGAFDMALFELDLLAFFEVRALNSPL
jgi:hypothetical protein